MSGSLPTRWHLLKIVISLASFVFALSFEDASSQRLTVLVVLFALFVVWDYIRSALKNRPLFFLIDGAIIYLMEYYSKFLVNYFFQLFYMGTIFEVGFLLPRRQANQVSAIIGTAALYKFAYALFTMWNARTVSEFLFNFFAMAFIITLSNYAAVQRESRKEKDELYRELLEAYKKLREYSEKIEEASVLRERNRIAREIHDTLGHRLVSLIMQLEIALRQTESNGGGMDPRGRKSDCVSAANLNGNSREVMERALVEARAALTDTRSAVKALKGREYSGIDAIIELAGDFEKSTGVKVRLRTPDIRLLPEQNAALYRAVQEALTNAAKHGRATLAEITIRQEDGKVFFDISNNGIGGKYKEGFGLRSMRERIEAIGGKLEITDGENFLIRGEFPS